MNVSEKLFDLFMALPPDYAYIERLIKEENCSRECISEAFCRFAEECLGEYGDFMKNHNRKPKDEEIHSAYILPLCKLLLAYGLDPNYVFGEKNEESNIMYEVYWIDMPYVAADTLKLLLENGGNPLLEVDDESIWRMVDFDIWFDTSHGYAEKHYFKATFDCRIHFWLVLRGFLSPKEECFKEHSLYTYKIRQGNLQIVKK